MTDELDMYTTTNICANNVFLGVNGSITCDRDKRNKRWVSAESLRKWIKLYQCGSSEHKCSLLNADALLKELESARGKGE